MTNEGERCRPKRKNEERQYERNRKTDEGKIKGRKNQRQKGGKKIEKSANKRRKKNEEKNPREIETKEFQDEITRLWFECPSREIFTPCPACKLAF